MGWSKLKSKEAKTATKSRRPKETPYTQQTMPAWDPVYTPKVSGIILLVISIILLAFGAFWMVSSSKVKEIRLDYTRCHQIAQYDTFETMPSKNVFREPKSSADPSVDKWKRSNQSLTFDGVTKNYTLCTMEFYLPSDMKPPVLFYYRLTNFFQNHRNYVTSFSSGQLKGKSVSLKSIKDSDCKDLDATTVNGTEKIIYPCGLIAASYFNDTFSNPFRIDSGSGDTENGTAYNMTKQGVASSNDRSFYKPSTYEIASSASAGGGVIVPPPSWAERYPNGYHSGNMFDPQADESFMVWMRTAVSPGFAKMAMRNNNQTMERGLYRLEVFSHFPAEKNGGTKSILITTRSMGGARNSFLGVANLGTGFACLVLAVIFGLSSLWKPRPLAYHIYLHGKQ